MKLIEVESTNPDTGQKVRYEYNFGADLAEAQELFGDEPVYECFLANAKNALQTKLHALVKEKKLTGEQVKAELADWKPRQKRNKKQDEVERFISNFGDMDDAEREAVLQQLKRKVQGG